MKQMNKYALCSKATKRYNLHLTAAQVEDKWSVNCAALIRELNQCQMWVDCLDSGMIVDLYSETANRNY